MILPSSSYTELTSLLSGNVKILNSVGGYYPPGYFSGLKNKIIVYSQIIEILPDEKIINLISQNPSKYFIFLLSHTISEDLKDQFKNRASFINLRYANAYYSNSMYTKDEIDINFNGIKNNVKSKHFLSLNNRADWVRQGLFYFFENFKLRNQSYFSYLANCTLSKFSLNEIDQNFDAGEYGKVWYANNINFAECKKMLPLQTEVDDKGIKDGIGNLKYYADCFCSIVTETYSNEQYPLFTEKIFRPILFYQPFLLHSNPYSFDALRYMGFQTFEPWIDQSYDALSGRQRFEAMLRIILEISEWSVEKLNSVYQEMMPVLEHNHNHFTKVLPMLYNDEIQQVKNQITEIVNNQ